MKNFDEPIGPKVDTVKIHQRFLDQWHKDAIKRDKIFMFSTPEAKYSFLREYVEPPYTETMKPWSFAPLGQTWRDPLAITAVAEAVGTKLVSLGAKL